MKSELNDHTTLLLQVFAVGLFGSAVLGLVAYWVGLPRDMWWVAVPTWVSAVGTAGAVIVALFSRYLDERRDRTELAVEFDLKAPFIAVVNSVQHLEYGPDGKPYSESVPTIYFRLCVLNKGRRPARNVQVFAAELREHSFGGEIRVRESFLPLPLAWTYRLGDEDRRTVMNQLPAGCSAFCDFCRSQIFRVWTPRTWDLALAGNKLVVTAVPEPSPDVVLLEKGRYELVLKVTSDNAAPVDCRIDLRYQDVNPGFKPGPQTYEVSVVPSDALTLR